MKKSIFNNRFVKLSFVLLIIAFASPVLSAYAAPEAGNEWTVSSSPATNALSIKSDNGSGIAKVQISDLKGNVVYSKSLKGGDNTISLDQISEGAYTISILNGQQVKTYKLKVL